MSKQTENNTITFIEAKSIKIKYNSKLCNKKYQTKLYLFPIVNIPFQVVPERWRNILLVFES